MTGFEAYYVYYLVNTVFFTYKKNPVGLFFSEKNKIRDKCIDIWNEKHIHTDGQLFLKVEQNYDAKTLPLVFINFYLCLDNCHPAKILSDPDRNELLESVRDWTSILKMELPKIKNKTLKVKNANIVTQAICYDIFGFKDKSTNSLEKEVNDRFRTKIKNMSLLLKFYWPREFETSRVRNYIKTVILKKEI